MFGDQPCCNRQPVIQKGRINPAFEALPRIAGQHQFLASAGDIFRREIGAFDQNIAGLRFRSGCGTTHDPADVMGATVVGNHGHRLVENIFLVVERGEFLARFRLARNQATAELGHIIYMQRPSEVEHHEIGDIDQQADRLLAGGFEMALHPGRSRAVGHAADGAGVEGGATFGVFDTDIGSGTCARNLEVCFSIGSRK